MKTHDELAKTTLSEPVVKAEEDTGAEDLALLNELRAARRRAGLAQVAVGLKMGTKAPAVARLEGSGGNRRHSPSVATLRRYAEAVVCRLEIRLRRKKSPSA